MGNVFTVTPNAYDYLAVGESVELTYTYNVIDSNGGVTPTTATIIIEGRNDAPQVSAAIREVTNEDEAPFTIDLLANSSDVDTTDNLSVSDVTETSGNDASGVVLVGNVFTVTPNAYDYLAVGESVELTYTYNVIDSNGGVTPTTATIIIEGRNDAPQVSAAIREVTNEDEAPFTIDLLTNSSDVDTTDNLSVSDVTETSGNDASGVVLVGNVFTVTPNAYDYLAVGESVELTYTYNVIDSNGGVTPTTATIIIEGRNDAPQVSAAIREVTNEDEAPFTIDLLANSSDVDTTDNLSVSDVTETSGNDASGVVLVGNVFTVTPNAYDYLAVGESVELTYTYNVIDSNGGVTPTTATIIIEGRNDAPQVSAAIREVTNEDEAPFTIDLLANSSDVDTTDNLSVSDVTETSGNDASGVVLVGNVFTVTPNAYDYLAVGESVELTYTYNVIDSNGGVTPTTATIIIEGRNDAPQVSAAIREVTNEDEAPFTIDLLANSSDVDTTDNLSVSDVTETSGNDASGVVLVGNVFTVTPNAYDYLAVGESVELTYTYNVIDSNGGVTPTTATIIIEGRNDAPQVSAAIREVTNEDEAPFTIDLLANSSDVDTTDNLSVSDVTETSGNDASGVVLVGNVFTVTPNAYDYLAVGESVELTYTYNVIDSNGGVTPTTATIIIEGRNDAPQVSAAIREVTNEDEAPFTIDLLANSSDVDTTDNLSVSDVTETSGNDASGVVLVGNVFTVTPNAYDYLAVGESVELTYTYNVIDSNGGVTPTTATIIIEGRNDAPQVSAAIREVTNEDEAPFTIDLLANSSDVDTTDNLSVSDVTETSGNDASGVVLVGNVFTVTPNAYDYLAVGESVELTYTYNVIDSNGGVTPTTATIIIEGRNDNPAIQSTTSTRVSEEGFADGLVDSIGDTDTTDSVTASGTISIEDVDGDALTVALSGPSGLTSGGETVHWSWDADSQTLTGFIGTVGEDSYQAIMTVALNAPANNAPGDWSYAVTLLAPVDHSNTAVEDDLSLNFGVDISDGNGGSTSGNFTVTIEDDSVAFSTVNLVADNAIGIYNGSLVTNGADNNYSADLTDNISGWNGTTTTFADSGSRQVA